MRFDDRLSTILVAFSGDKLAQERAWMQLVDVLSQIAPGQREDLRRQALAQARLVRNSVPERARRRTAAALSAQNLPLDVFQLFAEDQLGVAAPVLMRVQLSDAVWEEILPQLSVSARALVRERRDLSPFVRRALQTYGHADFALPPAPRESSQIRTNGQNIADLLARLEQRQIRRRAPVQPDTIRSFRFETDAKGVIRSVFGASAAALIGLELAVADDLQGARHSLAAGHPIRTPSACRAVDLVLPGTGPTGGSWRLSAVPCFAPSGDDLLGYRGVAKRLPSTQPAGSTHPPKDTAIALPDGLRQFIHELRTPLNAVRGFAELIASQIFGPVSQIYQRLAGQIIEDAEAIVDLLDDLPFFQPSQRKIAYGSGYQPIDPSGIIRQVFEKAQVAAMKRQALLVFQVDPDLPRLRLDGSLFRRLIERFIALVVALSGPHDQVHAQSSQRGQGLLLSVRRPHALRDVADAGLFDPNREPDYDHNVAPFGIGYGFRLVWALARALGGQLETSHSRLSLYVSG